MNLFKKFINQTRKPEGKFGEIMINGMNKGHARCADWGREILEGVSAENILEIGCGGGRNAAELLKRYRSATLTAIDYSETSVQKAREYNSFDISAGRCKVYKGDVSFLDFESEQFDLASAFETVYFWNNLEHCFREVFRVLKDGGCFLIVNESDGLDKIGLKFEKIIEGMKNYTLEELSDTLKQVGFKEISSKHHKTKPWISILAKK